MILTFDMLGIFLDTETTGLDPLKHRPIDLAIKIVDIGTGGVMGDYQSLVKQSAEVWKECDPDSMEVNGYTFEQVQEGKDPEVVAEEIKRLFKDVGIERGKAVFICQNPAFDRGFFNQLVPVYTQEKHNWPYHWLDLASMYWGQVVKTTDPIPKRIVVSKNAIGKQFGIPPEERPHRAINGVNHLIQCYSAVLELNWQ